MLLAGGREPPSACVSPAVGAVCEIVLSGASAADWLRGFRVAFVSGLCAGGSLHRRQASLPPR